MNKGQEELFNRLGITQTSEKMAFSKILIEKDIPKKEHLLKPHQTANHIHYVRKGAFRSYLLKDGEDISDYFFFEGNFAGDFAALFSQKPSVFYLEALEDSQVISIPYAEFLALAQQIPYFAQLARILAEKAFIEIEERMRLLHHASLETRFRWMLHRFPQVFQRVPQYHIASYLGVKPESLSRIKKQIGIS